MKTAVIKRSIVIKEKKTILVTPDAKRGARRQF
jgi:hypothetical protein